MCGMGYSGFFITGQCYWSADSLSAEPGESAALFGRAVVGDAEEKLVQVWSGTASLGCMNIVRASSGRGMAGLSKVAVDVNYIKGTVRFMRQRYHLLGSLLAFSRLSCHILLPALHAKPLLLPVYNLPFSILCTQPPGPPAVPGSAQV